MSDMTCGQMEKIFIRTLTFQVVLSVKILANSCRGYLVNFRMTSIKSFPYLSLLYSPIPLISPKASTVVGREEARRWSVLSERTM